LIPDVFFVVLALIIYQMLFIIETDEHPSLTIPYRLGYLTQRKKAKTERQFFCSVSNPIGKYSSVKKDKQNQLEYTSHIHTYTASAKNVRLTEVS
jgi:hypothetical protein